MLTGMVWDESLGRDVVGSLVVPVAKKRAETASEAMTPCPIRQLCSSAMVQFEAISMVFMSVYVSAYIQGVVRVP